MPGRIKILYVETYTHAAGGQRGLLDIVDYLDKRDFEPVVLLQGPGKLSEGLEKRGVRYVTRRLEPFKNRWLPFSWWMGVPAVLRVLRAEKPDVVHSNHLYAGRYSGRAAKKLGLPSLVTLRLVHEPEVFDRYNRWETLKCHTRIVANSDGGREVFEGDAEVKAKIITIKNGMDLDKFKPSPDRAALRARLGGKFGLGPESIVLVQVASMVPQKGNEDLLRAFIELSREHADLHLFFLGGEFAGTDNSGAIKAAAEKAGLSHRVHLTDYVWDVGEFLNLADISVLASRDREGLPRSIIEAMACGNPVVGTDVGGMRELIQDGRNGYLIPARDPGALQAALDRLIRDAGLRARMGAEGARLARENHDIRSMIAKYEAVYRELVAGKAR